MLLILAIESEHVQLRIQHIYHIEYDPITDFTTFLRLSSKTLSLVMNNCCDLVKSKFSISILMSEKIELTSYSS